MVLTTHSDKQRGAPAFYYVTGAFLVAVGDVGISVESFSSTIMLPSLEEFQGGPHSSAFKTEVCMNEILEGNIIQFHVFLLRFMNHMSYHKLRKNNF